MYPYPVLIKITVKQLLYNNINIFPEKIYQNVEKPTKTHNVKES